MNGCSDSRRTRSPSVWPLVLVGAFAMALEIAADGAWRPTSGEGAAQDVRRAEAALRDARRSITTEAQTDAQRAALDRLDAAAAALRQAESRAASAPRAIASHAALRATTFAAWGAFAVVLGRACVQWRRRQCRGERCAVATATFDIVQSMPSGLIIYEYQPPDRLVFVDANPAASELTGVDLRGSRGQAFEVLWPAAAGAALQERLLHVARTGDSYTVDDFVYQDERVAGTFRIVAFRMPGSRLGVAFENITEDRRTHEALDAANAELAAINSELAAKNAELEKMISMLSHDLKSPLVTICGFLGHVERDIKAGRSEHVEIFLKRISAAAAHMAQLIDGLLAFNRVGRVPTVREPVRVADIINEWAVDHDEALSHRRVKIDVASDLPTIMADRVQMTQVFGNLLDNALAYGCDPLEPRIECGGQVDERDVRLFVRDNGPGIPADQQNRIFNLFCRASKVGEGNGIGLAIVRRIAEAQGGQAWVESGAGLGTTFWVALPRTDAVPSAS